jgi:hypothetical protein
MQTAGEEAYRRSGIEMALKLGEGSETCAPLAQALIGGLALSVLFTVFLAPAGFYLAYRDRNWLAHRSICERLRPTVTFATVP